MTADLGLAAEVVAAVGLTAMAGAVVVVAWVVAWAATKGWGEGDRLLQLLVATVLALAQVVGVPLLLGVIGVLSFATVLAVHVALAAGAWWWRRAAREGAPSATATGRWRRLDLVGVAATAAHAAAAVGYSLRRPRSLDFDTKEYHVSNLATWLHEGSIWPLPYAQPGSVTATHPGNGELAGLWLSLPTHGDELAYAAPSLFGLLAIAAAAVAVRELRGGEPGSAGLGAVAAVAALTAPLYLVSQVHSLSTDLPAAAGLLAAVALLLVARRHVAGAPVVLAGIALGLGLGAKYTAFVPGALVALVAIGLLRRDRRWWLLVPGVVGLAGPWFLRNLLRTGNPLFPQDLPVADGGRSPYDQLNTSLLRHVVDGRSEVVRSWADLAWDLVGPVGLALVVAGLALAVRRRSLPDPGAAALVGALAVAAAVAYAATPVTGGGPTGLAFILASCLRYGMVAVLLGAVVWAAVAPLRLAAASLALIVAWNAWRLVVDQSPRPDVDADVVVAVGFVVFAVVALGLGRAVAHDRPLVRVPPIARGGAAALATVVLVAAGVHRNDRGRQSTELEAALLLEGADRPAVVLGVADLRAVLGPRLERPLVGVSRGGEAGEVPFADDAQLRRHVLGEDGPPPDPALGPALDRALAESDAPILVVGSGNPVAHPDGWSPDASWCAAGGDDQGTVYVRCSSP